MDGGGDEAEESVEPRGRAHRGYGGGPIDVPTLKPHVRVKESEAGVLEDEIRRRYDSGRSVRGLSANTGYSIARIRGLLARAGADIRSRGGSNHLSMETI
ncbi:MAG: helix-turn-helix domain-containing protein [Lacisediminihabitans sp.]